MAKKIKFPLVMKDDAEARTMEEFKAHFDIEKAVGYFLDGKLLAWLEARYYDTEADAVRALDKNDAELRKKLCGIFGAEYDEAETPALDMEEAQERSRKLAKLRQYTSDQAILDKVDSVAFDQEDLADLLDNDVHDIYLCNNSFVIPLRVEDKKYIGIGKAEAVIKSEEWVDFAAKKIVLENVEFDAAYEKVYEESAEGAYRLGKKYYDDHIYDKAVEYFQKAANQENTDAMNYLGTCYTNGYGVSIDREKGFQWYSKAANLGNAVAMYSLYMRYCYGEEIEQNHPKAEEWLRKSADAGFAGAMNIIGQNYIRSGDGYETNCTLGMQWLNKAASKGDIGTMIRLGEIYAGTVHYQTPIQKDAMTALMWYEKALASDTVSDYDKGTIYENIGDLYANGDFGNNERSKALEWYNKAVSLGDKYSVGSIASALGDFYKDEANREFNIDEALEWYAKSVEAGWEKRSFNVGAIYERKGNYKEAVKWYERYMKCEDNYVWGSECETRLQQLKAKFF